MQAIPHFAHKPKKLARQLARLAVRALYMEVKIFPKPGLVSFVDCGAHRDMNGETFLRSLFSLRHYFYQLVLMDSAQVSFNELKKFAMHSEARMLVATRGINTHRGAIFSLGLMSISAARLLQSKREFNSHLLQQQFLQDWLILLSDHHTPHSSHGQQVKQQFQIIGAKEMAQQGYPVIFSALEQFLSLFEVTNCLNQSGLYAYAYFLRQIDDTNVLYRCGERGMRFARKKAEELLALENLQQRTDLALQVHQEFSQQNLSPGGVGDLIATLLFISQLFNEKLRCHY